MIITCPNCYKQFKIDHFLIPQEGRDVQCGSCNNIWFYKIEEEKSETLKLKDEIDSKDNETIANKKNKEISDTKESLEKNKTQINNEINNKISEKLKNTTVSKKTENIGSKFLSYLIVFFISFLALILLVDTLKTQLISVFPGLELLLFNLFETLQDIKLFIIDLI